jgi:acyl-CoA reductase-like NAD-dependent aldehyde dehydrogenase
MSVETITTISPITNKPILTRNGVSAADLKLLPEVATEAFLSFRKTTLADRQAIVKKALKILGDKQDILAKELTEQMGRPIAYTAKEVTTAVKRGEYLLKISEETLKDTEGEAEKEFKRFIRKVPVGPVLILFAWNVSLGLSELIRLILTALVSIFDSGQLSHTRPSRRQFSYLETFPPNTNHRRAYLFNFHRSWPSSECHTIFPLRIANNNRVNC